MTETPKNEWHLTLNIDPPPLFELVSTVLLPEDHIICEENSLHLIEKNAVDMRAMWNSMSRSIQAVISVQEVLSGDPDG